MGETPRDPNPITWPAVALVAVLVAGLVAALWVLVR
jgi:hypothetical protein